MNISDIKTQLPAQCSGGEQQRCAIARALINKPELVFADEPTGALNRKNTVEVLDLLTECNREGQSILMVTHDMRAALRATRILYIEDGKIIGDMTMPPYKAEDEKSRETQVNSWLSSMSW
jgi:putative ABC transport system ATP-binding protein